MEEILREATELTDHDLDVIGGGQTNGFAVHAQYVEINQININSLQFGNMNLGIGPLGFLMLAPPI
jgi:hypothetical protein